MLNTIKSRFMGKTFIVLLLIMTASLFSQGWNNVVPTTIPFDNLVGLDLCSNKDGSHVLVNNHAFNGFPVVHTYTLKYYLLNSSGSVIRSFTLENFQGNDGGIDFANIDGDNDKIYVVYKLGNQLKTRKSTNAGQSWVTTIDNINLGNNICNHVDITFGKDDNGLHVVWATQDAGSDFKTYYQRLDPSNAWGPKENVTDGSNVGGFPTVSKSTNRVHVSYNTGQSWDPETNLGVANSRDKLVSTWQTSQIVQSSPMCFRERIFAGSSKLFDFNYQLKPGYYASDLYVKERLLNSSTWSSGQILKSFAGVREIVSAANSVDGKTHIVYEISGGVGYRNYNGSSWISESTIGEGYNSPRIYSVSNDLFTVWGKDWPNGFIQYRQYDAVPLTPQNFSATTYDNHPKITWSTCNEADVYSGGSIKVFRGYEDGLGYISWMLAATLSGNSTSWVDNNVTLGDKKTIKFYYKICSVDVGENESPTTTPILFYGTGPIWKNNEDNNTSNIKTFSLSQNYPNPFNPSTKISYSIKEEGLVTLKVYNVLGKEVATLVNENKPAGTYEADFDASQLPSGMYIYKLQSGSFTDVKKMLLTK